MSILVKQALGHVHHELGRDLPSEIDPLWVVNTAGRELDNMRSWGWQRRPTASLHLRANVSYVELPDDFGSICNLWATDETVRHARWVGLEELAYRRATQASFNDTLVSYLALAAASSDARGGGPPVNRLEVFGTPSTTTLGAFVLLYRSCWVACTDAAQYLPIDESCDLLYIEILRAVAQGLQKGHEATLSQRLDVIRAGSAFHNAAAFDIRRNAAAPAFTPQNAYPIWPVPRVSGGAP